MSYFDEFDEPRRGLGYTITKAFKNPAFALFSVVLALCCLGAILWFSYPKTQNQNLENLPVITADTQALKVRPDNPGGMQIPHRDSTVFSSLRNSRHQQETTIENLLASDEPETPMPRSQLFAGINTDTAPQQSTPIDITESANATPKQPEVPADIALKQMEENLKIQEKAQETAAAEKKAAEERAKKLADAEKEAARQRTIAAIRKAVKTEPAAGPAITPGNFYVQLGSVRTRNGADSEWKVLQKKYPTQLNSLQYRVQTANLGEKGTFYRIQAGPVSKDSANSVCNSIKSIQPGGCLVISGN